MFIGPLNRVQPSELRRLRFVDAATIQQLLHDEPKGITGHLAHGLDALNRGDRDGVRRHGERAYRLGYELCDPRAREDAERVLNAAGWVVGRKGE